MKYKVGDRVRIKSLDWYNENKDEGGFILCGKWYFTPYYQEYCGKTLTIKSVCKYFSFYDVYGNDGKWTDEMIECKIEE